MSFRNSLKYVSAYQHHISRCIDSLLTPARAVAPKPVTSVIASRQCSSSLSAGPTAGAEGDDLSNINKAKSKDILRRFNGEDKEHHTNRLRTAEDYLNASNPEKEPSSLFMNGYPLQSNSNSILTSSPGQNQKKPDWNRAVSEAEKIVGYPTSYLSLRCLLSDEISNIAIHVRKLVGTSHPLLKTAKAHPAWIFFKETARLVYNGRTNMQTRGLIVLLISKAAGHLTEGDETERPGGVSHSQRALAEITEMIHTAHLIHKGVVNVSESEYPDSNVLHDMEYGNKIAILSGDYLLANACSGLAGLRNSSVVELVSKAISNFTEAEFSGSFDSQDNPIPTGDMTMEDWEAKNFLAAGSLMAQSCKATLLLAGHSEDVQKKGFEFGKHIALSWQALDDLQPFMDLYRCPPGTQFDLTSIPVILHMQEDPRLFKYISTYKDSVDSLDFKKMHSMIMEGNSIPKAKALCRQHAESALDTISYFEPSDARHALENIIHAIMNID